VCLQAPAAATVADTPTATIGGQRRPLLGRGDAARSTRSPAQALDAPIVEAVLDLTGHGHHDVALTSWPFYFFCDIFSSEKCLVYVFTVF
jgi:hypothetical protein